MSKPTGFKDFEQADLYTIAVEDFAVDVTEKDNKEILLAALLESGVTWDQYLEAHPEHAPEEATAPVPPVSSGEVIAQVPAQEKVIVRVQEEVVPAPNEAYLIKMTRENLLYETRGHRFTQAHPYALVSPEDAQFILSQEDGFRQALPSELEEFYS